MPEFLEIDGACAFRRFDPERGVAALAAAAGDVMAPFHRLRQREEGLHVLQRARDQRGVQAVIGDDGEAGAGVACADGGREGVLVVVQKPHRNGGDGAEHAA